MMWARVTTIRGPLETLEQGADLFDEHVLPWIRDVSGFRGMLGLVDAEGEQGMVITFWEDAEAMHEFEQTGVRFRDLITESAGSKASEFTSYEVRRLDLPGLESRP
jgi:heme-degrading monooxygenase HmoA